MLQNPDGEISVCWLLTQAWLVEFLHQPWYLYLVGVMAYYVDLILPPEQMLHFHHSHEHEDMMGPNDGWEMRVCRLHFGPKSYFHVEISVRCSLGQVVWTLLVMLHSSSVDLECWKLFCSPGNGLWMLNNGRTYKYVKATPGRLQFIIMSRNGTDLANNLSTTHSVTDISTRPTTTPIIVGSVWGSWTWWRLSSVKTKTNII